MDPEVQVRVAAVRSLGNFGVLAIPFLEERLSDTHSQVRMNVVRALMQADSRSGLRIISRLLATPPSPSGIEAARMIALSRPDVNIAAETHMSARMYLRAALRAHDSNLRSQASVALVSSFPRMRKLIKHCFKCCTQSQMRRCV